MKEKPDYWAPWTKPVPLPVCFVLSLFTLAIFLPVCITIGLAKGIGQGFGCWWGELTDIWRVMKGRHDDPRT